MTQSQYDREVESGNIDENALYLTTNTVTSIENGGTGATDGVAAMKNLFASGEALLSSYQYGTELPTDNSTETVGRIFFKKVNDQ